MTIIMTHFKHLLIYSVIKGDEEYLKKKEKNLFYTEECQLESREGTAEIENQHLFYIVLVNNNHQ